MMSLGEKVIRGCILNLASSWKRGLMYRVYEHWGGLTLLLAAEKGQKKLA